MTEPVLLHVDGTVGEVVLNRPDALNAVNGALASALLARLDEAAAAGIRALVLRGEGRAFCAGRDLADAMPLEEDGEQILDEQLNPLVERVADFPAPTFAAVHGAVLGTGFGLAFACDVVLAADDSKIGSPFARIGAVLDGGAHHVLAHRVGTHRALELVYTGRFLDGVEAASWGLVNRSVPASALLGVAREMATAVAAGPTHAFVASKRLLRRVVDENLSLPQTLRAEAAAQGLASRTHDYREGILAFQERRAPTFTGD